jgi:polar amino acid transport system substrate-binding protein
VTQAPPWYSKDPKSGEWSSGLGVSMGKAMAGQLGVKFEPVEVTWGTAIAALQGNKIDIMYDDGRHARARAGGDFPASAAAVLFAGRAGEGRSAGQELGRPEQADTVRIAVPQASSMDKFVSENLPKANRSSASPATPRRLPPSRPAVPTRCACSTRRCWPRASAWARGKIVVPTPAQSQPSSAAVRKDDDKAFVQLGRQVDRPASTQRPDPEVVRGIPGRLRPGPEGAPPVMKEMI